ncbi:MAG TPA: sugar transferase [Planctomycetota bacterium]|nr:sugar transferase [Planctomycetota bacterium]
MREGRLRTQALALAVCDAFMVVLAMQIAWWVRFDFNAWLNEHGYWHISVGWTPKYPYFVAVFVTLPLFWLILRELGLYDAPESRVGEFFRICAATLVSCVLLAALSFAIRSQQVDQQFQYSRAYSFVFFFAAIVCLVSGRWFLRILLRAITRSGIGENRILFVGDGPLAHELARALDAMGANRVVGTLKLRSQEFGVRSQESGVRSQESGISHGDCGAGGPPAQSAQNDNKLKPLSKAFNDSNRYTALSEADPSQFPLPVLGDSSQLCELAAWFACDEVVVVLPNAPKETLRELAEDCYRAHVRFRMVPDVYDMLLDHMNLTLVADIPLLGMRGSRIEGVNFLFKRIFDIVVSFVLLVLLVPTVFLAAAIAIKVSDSGPIFYYQERIGFRRRRFRFWKFRSMRAGADKDENVQDHKNYLKKYIAGEAEGTAARGKIVYKITQDPRVTRVGRILRQFSIDELPQLWNVLKGEMSLIGPRPPVAYEVENYRPIHLRRFEVLPGISGLWQVSGRNRLTFEEMVKLDLYYIENWSLELDVRILFKTVSVVLFHRAY